MDSAQTIKPSAFRRLTTPGRIQLLAGVLISAVTLFFVLGDIHWAEVSDALGDANYGLIALAVLTFVGLTFLRGVRWGIILRPPPLVEESRDGGQPADNLRLFQLFGCLNVAYFINNVLPLHTGDIWRAFLLSTLAGLSTARTLSTILVERVLDILSLLLLLLLLAPFLDIPSWARGPAITIAVACSGLTIGLIVASSRRRLMLGLFDRLLVLAPARARPKLRDMASAALDGLRVLADPVRTLQLLVCSIAIWLVAALIFYLGLRAFDIGLGYEVAVFLLITTTFGFFVPASPGSFGVYHAIIIGGLTTVFGVETTLAVSYALTIHLVFYLPPMLIGPAFLWRERDKWRSESILARVAKLRSTQTNTPALDEAR
jgi:uncharacterized protein (TIRG00374 family)